MPIIKMVVGDIRLAKRAVEDAEKFGYRARYRRSKRRKGAFVVITRIPNELALPEIPRGYASAWVDVADKNQINAVTKWMTPKEAEKTDAILRKHRIQFHPEEVGGKWMFYVTRRGKSRLV
jgi:hypothetical protein